MLSKENRINTKSQLKDWLRYECRKYGFSTPVTLRHFLPIEENDVLWNLQMLMRKTEYYRNSGKKLLYKFYNFRYLRMQSRHGVLIPLNTCGRGLRIMHLGPVLINGKATVGKDCSFHINTAVVSGGTNDLVPTLGDGVILAVGAVVLGDVTLADHVAVAANAVVTRSFDQPDITVGGIPARKISDRGALCWGRNARTSGTKPEDAPS